MFTRFNKWNTNLNLDVDPGAGGGDGDFPAYMAQMPDEYKEDKDIAKNVKLGDLAKHYKELLTTTANIPKAPENAEGYEFDAVTYPEGFGSKDDPELVKAFRTVMFESGLNKEQANKMFQFFAKSAINEFNADKQQFETNKTAADEQLKKDWPGEEYAKNMALRDRYIAKFGDEEMQKDLDATGMGNKPSFLKHVVKVAKAVGEDALGPGGPKAPAPSDDKETVLKNLYPNSPGLFDSTLKGPGVPRANVPNVPPAAGAE